VPVPLTLKVFKGEQLISSKDFDRDLIKIGRLASAHLTLDDEKVARIHAVIDVAPDGTLSVTDMGTVEGTMLNGKRVMKSALSFGDAIQVGGTTIRIEKAGAAAVAAPVADAAATQPFVATVAAPQVVAAQVQDPVAYRPPPAPPEEVVEDRISPRMRPRRRKGTGPLGLELRFLWGDHIVGEHFLAPGMDRSFKVGSGQGVDFDMGDIAGPLFELVRLGKKGAQLRFTATMEGEVHRKFGDEVLSLADAKKKGLAQADGDAVALTLSNDDFAWIDLGGITVEAFFQPVPKPVFVPFSETVDFTVLNIFLVAFFIAALFIISAANRDAEGDEFADDLNDNQARIAKLLIKPPENQKNPILEKYEKKKDSGEVAAKRKGDEGSAGKKEAPKRSAHAAPKGDPNNKDQARLLVAKVFGGGTGGISTIFGHQGLGGELKSAMGNMFGAAPGDAAGLGGLGLRGSGSGGGGLGDTIGIGGIGTRGRGGGTGGYGTGVGVLGGKKDVDIGITSSEPTVMGSLDKELIRKVIHSNRSQIRFCYESQLNRFPKLEGKVAVKFVISASGAVATSSVAQSSVSNAELEACVAGRVRTWVFPKPKGGGVVLVTYPFIFKQSGS
jgi:TonB family protein